MRREAETDETFATRYEQLREKVYVNAHAKFIAGQLFVYESVSDADIESFVRLNRPEPVSYYQSGHFGVPHWLPCCKAWTG